MSETAHDASAPRYPLIGPHDPPPCTLINSAGRTQAVLVGDHAGRAFPETMRRLGLGEEVLDQHVAWDIGSGELIRRLAVRLDTPAVLAGYSRLVVDCNRSLDDPSAFPEVSDGITIPGNQGLSAADKALRVRAFYQPYRNAIEAALDGFRSRGIIPALIAIHSFTPELAGVRRPWNIGILWDTDPRIPVPLITKLRSRGDLIVGDNAPYSGKHPADFTIDHHGEAAGLPHVSIEVRQDLIATAAGAQYWADILGEALGEILADPALYRLWDSRPSQRP